MLEKRLVSTLSPSPLNIFLHNVTVVRNLVLLVVYLQDLVDVLLSIFVLLRDEYDSSSSSLSAVLGDIPPDVLLKLWLLITLDFASNGLFYGTSEEEFGSHITSLTFFLP